MGRPTKLTPELQAEMVRIIRAGNYQVVACKYVGISERTFHNWINRGKRGWKIDAPYVQFLQAIEEASAAAEIESVARIRASARDGNLDSDKFFLTHGHPERWGRHVSKHEHTGPEGKPITIRVVYEDDGGRD